jgi:hypothetical protein
MTKAFLSLFVSLFVLSVFALGGTAAAEPDPCSYCPLQVVQGSHFNATINDCSTLHGYNEQNLTSYAEGTCGGSGLCESFYRATGCSSDETSATAYGRVEYRCACWLASLEAPGQARNNEPALSCTGN